VFAAELRGRIVAGRSGRADRQDLSCASDLRLRLARRAVLLAWTALRGCLGGQVLLLASAATANVTVSDTGNAGPVRRSSTARSDADAQPKIGSQAPVVAERGRLRGGAAPADLHGREVEKSGEGVQWRRQPAPVRPAGPGPSAHSASWSSHPAVVGGPRNGCQGSGWCAFRPASSKSAAATVPGARSGRRRPLDAELSQHLTWGPRSVARGNVRLRCCAWCAPSQN
jgi:hypothetical protein